MEAENTQSASARTPTAILAGLPDSITLISFAAFIIVSGGASVAIRFTYAELAPFWGAAARFVIGAVIFWILVAIRKVEFPRGQALVGAVLYGSLAVGAAFILIYWGLTRTPASLYQVLMASVPLLTLFLAAIHGLEKITTRGVDRFAAGGGGDRGGGWRVSGN